MADAPPVPGGADQPAEPVTAKTDITVAGHSVLVEVAGARLDAHTAVELVTARALHLFNITAGYARRTPVGFAAGGAHVEYAGDAHYSQLGPHPLAGDGRGSGLTPPATPTG